MLEPDRRYGHAYLSATAEALNLLEGLPEAPARPARRTGRRLPRLALVSHDAHFHGAQMLALNLARQFAESEALRPEVLLGDDGELRAAFAEAAPTRLVPGRFADAAAWRAEADLLAAGGVRAALCNTVVSAQALPALRRAGLQVGCLVHEMPELILHYDLAETARCVAREADVVIFPSEAVRAPFVAQFGWIAGRTMVRPQGLYRPALPRDQRGAARGEIRRQLGVSDSAFLAVGLGFGDRRKGVDLWPALAQSLRERGADIVLVWVGDLEQSMATELRAAIAKAGLQRLLLLPGRSTAPERYLAAADAFLLTSREDPLPSAALEAAAHDLPVLCFEGSGGIPPLLRECGLAPVPMDDIPALADAIEGLAADPLHCAEIGARAAAIVAERFDFSAYAADLVAAMLPARAVSVIVPNFNYARYLPQRLQSIRAQGHAVAEVILLDDASNDGSQALLQDLAARFDVPVQLVLNEKNSGSVCHQWARGVEMARAPFVWIAEADDLAEAGFLDSLLPCFDDAGVVMAYCQSRQIDAEGRVTAPDYLDYTGDIDAQRWRADYTRSGHEEIAAALAVKNTIPNVSAALFRRDALAPVIREALPELLGYRNAADWVLYMRLLLHGRLAFRAAALNQHRRHAGSVTIAAANKAHLAEISRSQELAASLVPVSPKTSALAVAFLGAAARQFGLNLESNDA